MPKRRTLAIAALSAALLVSFLALRDAAGRLDAPPDPNRASTADTPLGTGSPGVGTAFTPGPLLGDLKQLMILGPAAADVFPEPERYSLEGVTIEGDRTDPPDDGPRRPRKPRKPSGR